MGVGFNGKDGEGQRARRERRRGNVGHYSYEEAAGGGVGALFQKLKN